MKENRTKIKICGLTKVEEALMMNKYKPEYVGFVLFYEKSKRNNSVQNAWQVLRYLDKSIKKVAVTVSPTKEQLQMIDHMGFDYLQVHGELNPGVAKTCKIPILRAYNIGNGPVPKQEQWDDKIAGYVLDGQIPGSGKTFDWDSLKQFDRRGRLLVLAGGLHAGNVRAGIEILQPDIVDVSSGVESDEAEVCKDEMKVKSFIRKVREI